ncbi:MAG: hypothetical protein APF82_00820 [Sphingomonadales bacterium BRH_c42]|nr:MAG: hypothetical protein APF82_00820 [Sphingomonadales bacterium BRH_c42]
MTPWQWWIGSYGNVEYEDAFELGDFTSRDEAIEAGRKEWPGKVFYIVEARTSTAAKYADGSYDVVPFCRQRNRELIEPVASVAIDQIADHIRARSAGLIARRDRLKPRWWQFRLKQECDSLDAMASELDLIVDEIQDMTHDY